MSPLDPRTRVADIATTRPRSIPLFHRLGIDFCCGGQASIEDACRLAGLTVPRFQQELEGAEAAVIEQAPRWDQASLDALVTHILERYHRPLDEALPRLATWSEAVQSAHGHRAPGRFERLHALVQALGDELVAHVEKEEQIVFPWLLRGTGATAGEPLGILVREHETLGAMLAEVRELTDGFQTPDDACATWRALWEGLRTLERDCHEHIHLENNVLFPRALAAHETHNPNGGER